MSRSHSIFALVLPALATLTLVGWLVGYPLVAAVLANDLSTVGDAVWFGLQTLSLLGVRALWWLILSVGAFGLGSWLVLATTRGIDDRRNRLLGLGLVHLPVLVLGLGIWLGEYRGP